MNKNRSGLIPLIILEYKGYGQIDVPWGIHGYVFPPDRCRKLWLELNSKIVFAECALPKSHKGEHEMPTALLNAEVTWSYEND